MFESIVVLIFYTYIGLSPHVVAAEPGDSIPEKSKHEDFLIEYIYIYIFIVVALFGLQIVVLVALGQRLFSRTGIRLWWGNIHSPENSQHITDWYTFTHIVHGCLMYFLTLPLPHPPMTVNYSFLIGLCTAVTWEIVENTPCIIERYRKTGASTEYSGDSVINSVFDSVAMSLGFWVAYFIPWWVTLILVILEEVILCFFIRDNMILNVVQVLYPFKCISDWQTRGKNTKGDTPVAQIEEAH